MALSAQVLSLMQEDGSMGHRTDSEHHQEMDISCCGDYSDASPVAEMATESEWFALRLLCVVFFFFSSVLLLCYFLYPKLQKAAAGDEESGEPLPPAMILGKIGGGGITTDVCVICLEEFRRNDAVRVLVTCRHVFHVQCIDSWCLYKLACPVCRAPFRLFGFISLDCGLPSNEPPYNEQFTNLTYISDANFIQGGKTGYIQNNSETVSVSKPNRVLRYFPDGIRNCYSLSVTQDTKYLIRTVFVYGNYDGLNSPPRFDLYLGPNIWTSLDLKTSGLSETEEIIHITRSNSLDICVVKTGTSTPLISVIELRPLPYHTYTTRTGSLRTLAHLYFSYSDKIISYPKDVYDRIWEPYFLLEWTQITTTLNVTDSSNGYAPPRDAITTAAIPTNASEPLTNIWSLETSDDETYGYLYFAEIQQLRANETREFKIVANGRVDYDSYSPMNFEADTVFNHVSLKCEGAVCRLQLLRTPKSTLPPQMNAMEIFSAIYFPQSETSTDDVIAIKNIQSTYNLSRTSWQGDPCVPKQFSWIGLSCNVMDTSTPPRIITLDLSESGLTGMISPSIQNLSQLQELDLSNNNLTGEVPEFLAKMTSLLVIDGSPKKEKKNRSSGLRFTGFSRLFALQTRPVLQKSAFKKKSENNQISSSFDLLAAVAGKLLLESGGVSSSSSNNASGDNNEDQCGGKKESGDQMVVGETHCDHHHDNNAERSFFVSEILPKAHEMESFNRSPNPNKDFLFGSTSGITYEYSSEKLGTQELAYEEAKIHNGDCFRSDSNGKKPMLERLNCEPELSRNKDKHHIDNSLNGMENNDGENFSARYATKSFRSTLRVGDGRVKKVMSSKYCKVSSNQKDTMVAGSDLDLKPGYYSKKHCFKSLRSEKKYPIKKRRYFDGYTASQSEETVRNEGLSGSPRKAFLSTIACQKQPALQSRDSHVKLGIKSFRVPELSIEVPETATIGSLKRTVLEAVTTILEGGLRIGVLVHGKKVRDDNKMLLQTGISLDTLSDTLSFCLETNPPQSTKPLSPKDSDYMRPCYVPHTITRCLPSLGKRAKPSDSVESDLDSKPSSPFRAKPVYSRALIPVSPPLHAQALNVVPPRKPKRSEVAQRRIRRPFSVAEVEALVQAVERLGTGRWRDVKLRAFDNAKHRTYVDLKDKWKTLVHTARISPQQRRGEPVPQELLDRVLMAHAYWSQQQGKQQLLEGPQNLETSLGL